MRAGQLDESEPLPDGRQRRDYVQSLDGAEMRSRWDMQAAPPDILITNYSMLNVMLMRERDDSFFEQTRAWIAQDPSHIFHMVVDELHLYRGTQVTEVAYCCDAFGGASGLPNGQTNSGSSRRVLRSRPMQPNSYLGSSLAMPTNSA